jgi:hypothetical protein
MNFLSGRLILEASFYPMFYRIFINVMNIAQAYWWLCYTEIFTSLVKEKTLPGLSPGRFLLLTIYQLLRVGGYKTLAAIDRFVTRRLERNSRFFSASSAKN